MRIRERWRAFKAPVARQIAMERRDARPRGGGACNAPVGRQMAVERGGYVSERQRACNSPVVKPIVVEGGDACQRDVESVQRTCRWTDGGGKGDARLRGGERATHL